MNINQDGFSQIAVTLARHFECLYYINIETGEYTTFVPLQMYKDLHIPEQGDDFFAQARRDAPQYVHPGDLKQVFKFYDKVTMLNNLSHSNSYSAIYRLFMGGKIVHMRHIGIMCEDKKHVIFSLENIEAEFCEKEEQRKNLLSAERMARRDDLTGIRNKNAYTEYIKAIDDNIQSEMEDYHFGIIMCDLNDLKYLNDTRGHSFGDEALQRTSRIICDIYKHSPVFRIGGDEFVVILSGQDYEDREHLLKVLREESISNRNTQSGPVIACGMAIYEPDTDTCFSAVFKRADHLMYENKSELKSIQSKEILRRPERPQAVITENRKRLLDKLFGALYTVSGGGYVYLNDLRYDYSRWSLPLVDDFDMHVEYMYQADKFWQERIHPDDVKMYREAVDEILCGDAEMRPLHYRARKSDGTYTLLSTRGFVLIDNNGEPEYFGGIIIPQ